MALDMDVQRALRAAVALINGPRELETVRAVAALICEAGNAGGDDMDPADLGALGALRGELRELLTSSSEQAVLIVNRILVEEGGVPRLVHHDELGWHLRGVSADAPLLVRIRLGSALAMAELIRAGEISRLGICADRRCDGVVLDLSRNRSRRFCSAACGNRNAVVAYRARRASGQDG